MVKSVFMSNNRLQLWECEKRKGQLWCCLHHRVMLFGRNRWHTCI